ncbi:MAG: oxygen-independent coproporphyrinogen III oxidase [Halioglobus sp.]|nr:oxygen-independent coproporphyrinogen III oxidase [Halioglobus sp.]
MSSSLQNQGTESKFDNEFAAEMELARKYASEGPRYTSYPTAPQFNTDFCQAGQDWLAMESTESSEPLSLYVHLPFCNDICYYCGCNKVVTREPGAARAYLDRLEKEIIAASEKVGPRRPVTQMHWGGGTPTFLDGAEITELLHVLASHFRLLDKGYREYTIEIDPRTVTQETIPLLKGIGFNRISLGIQDFDPLVQKAVNRLQPFASIASLVDSIRAHGFRSLSFDLIYGLPHQDRQSMSDTLDKVIALGPDRIACYNYAHLPERFPSQRSIDRLTLPKPEEKLLLQLLISHRLKDAGYVHIGMDHYVMPGDDLAQAQREGRLQRNFQGYSLHLADDLVGLGVSAISEVGDTYLQNTRSLEDYYARIDSGEPPAERGIRLGSEDRLRRHVIMTLICELRLDTVECSSLFGVDFKEHFRSEIELLQPMETDGLLQVGENEIVIHEQGRPFLRNICMPFDAYLAGQAATRFSATV